MTGVRGPIDTSRYWIPFSPARSARDLELRRLRIKWTADAKLCAACHRPLLPTSPGQTRHPTCYPTDDTYRKAIRA